MLGISIIDWPVRADCGGAGDCGPAGVKEDCRGIGGNAADARLDVRADADRGDLHCGRAHVLPGVVPGTDGRARVDAAGPNILTEAKPTTYMKTMSTKVEFKYSELFRQAVVDAFKKLHPRDEIKNLVMFVVWLGSIWTTVILFLPHQFNLFNVQICFWLWFTCLFANFAEAMAEGRGKAHADALRKMRTNTTARKLVNGKEIPPPGNLLKMGDLYVCEAGDIIAADGEIVEGIATVDESAITGESAPVVRESGGDRSAVTGGTRVTSDRIVVKVTAEEGNSFLDKMIEMIEGARRQKTPNEIALNIVLVSLTALFIVVVFVLPPYAHYNENAAGQKDVVLTSAPVLLALIVCLIPTTIGGLLSAIGIAGIDRLMRRNVLATSGRAVEAAGDVDVLLLDKTGTITLGNRQASEFIPGPGVKIEELADAAQLASLADETPEGRSIVILAKEKYGLRGREIAETFATFIPFTAQTRMSGVDLYDERHGACCPPRGMSARTAQRGAGRRCYANRPSQLMPSPFAASAKAHLNPWSIMSSRMEVR